MSEEGIDFDGLIPPMGQDEKQGFLESAKCQLRISALLLAWHAAAAKDVALFIVIDPVSRDVQFSIGIKGHRLITPDWAFHKEPPQETLFRGLDDMVRDIRKSIAESN